MRKKTCHKIISLALAALLVCALLALPAMAAETEKKTVRVPVGMNNALYLDDNGKLAGYCAYFVQQLAYVNNWQLEYVQGSWNESVQNLYDGKIDLLFPTQKTSDRLDKMAFSEYIGGYQPIALYAREDDEIYYDDFAAFNGKRVAISENTSNEALLAAFAKENNFTYTPVPMDTTEEKVQALQDGSVDMIVFSTLNEVPGAKIVSMLDYLPFYYCTRMEDTALMAEVNSGIKKIFSESPNVVSDVFDSVLKGSAPISFTREENSTIQKTSSIRVGVYEDALPLSGADENGTPIGIYADLLKAISEKAGIPIEVVLIPRGKLLYSSLNDGGIDFVMGSKYLAYNEADVSGFMCSEAIMDYVTVAITRADYKFSDAGAPAFILTSSRKYWESEIYKQFPNATVRYCADVKECLAAVQSGKADVTLINTWEYNYQSKNARFSGMMEWESLRKQTDLVLGVKKGTDPTIMSIIEKAIDQVAGQDKDAIVATNLNMPYTSYTAADTWYSVKNMVLATGAVALVLLGAFLFFLHVRRQHTEELQAKNRQLQESNAAKDVFLSRMSHELRTPLNAISGYAAVMEENIAAHTYDEEKAGAYMDAISRAVEYQMAIIGDLLDIQKIESGKIQLHPITVNFTEYMNSIVAMIAPEAKEKGVSFAYRRLSRVHDAYLLDGARFGQVLLNLLHNAIKFTPAGGRVHMTAELAAQEGGTNVLKFVIADTGIGMSEDFQKNYLFQRFAQEYKGNTSPYEGCGTGLAISREIMHLMGGEITCESTQGVGSVFTVILPAQPVAQKRSRRGKVDYAAYALPGVRVLLCEDNKMNQDIECRLLEKMGCTVDVAGDGAVGVQRFSESAVGGYDVVLMDIRMPNMDGLQATRAIRALPRADAATVPILAVSANSFEEDVQKSLAAGMNCHIPKPVDVRVLYREIRKVCPQASGKKA